MKISKIKRITKLFSYLFLNGKSVFIGDIPHKREVDSCLKNMYDGYNYKFKAFPYQYCKTLTSDLREEEQEITFISVHENIPLYIVTLEGGIDILTSPLNSIIVLSNNRSYRKVDLENEDIIGEYVPFILGDSLYGKMITNVHYTQKNVTMYDISMENHHTFLTSDGIYLYDTVSIHVPTTHDSAKDIEKMFPSNQLYVEESGSITTIPEHSAILALYDLSKTKEGRSKINDILPKTHQISKGNILTKNKVKDLFMNIVKDPDIHAGKIMNELRILGDNTAFENGYSIGLDDIEPLKSLQKKVFSSIDKDFKTTSIKENSDYSKIYLKNIDKVTNELKDHFKKNDDSILGKSLLSGARGSESQIRDLLIGPIAVSGERMIKQPIIHSYGEGLSPAEYWNAAQGARKGIIGRAQSTAMPGALGKEILATANQLITVNESPKNLHYINLSVDNTDDILDRVVGADVKDSAGNILIRKDEIVTSHEIQRAKKAGLRTLPVLTPLQNSNHEGAIPSKAYGVGLDGKIVEEGKNIGAISAFGLVQPLFTGSMSSFHSGGALSGARAGYPRIKQLLELTKKLPGEATLAEYSGKVDYIGKDELGGHTILINNKEHSVDPINSISVKEGDIVKKGDILSSGPIQPSKLAELTSLDRAQEYMVDELKKQSPSLRRRSIETIVEGITRFSEIKDPGDSSFLQGDIVLTSKILKENKDINNKINFDYVFKGVNTLPQSSQSWLSKLNFRNLKQSFEKDVNAGSTTDIHSYEPAPAMAFSSEFGLGSKGKY